MNAINPTTHKPETIMNKSKMHKITLSNRFHNTEVSILAPMGIDTEVEAWMWLQEQGYHFHSPRRSTYLRVRRVLCGMSDCSCGIVR